MTRKGTSYYDYYHDEEYYDEKYHDEDYCDCNNQTSIIGLFIYGIIMYLIGYFDLVKEAILYFS